jgi:hypothetical protein
MSRRKTMNEKEIERLKDMVHELSDRLNNGRNYLMSVDSDKITVEDALEAFGYGRNGLNF